MSILFISLLAKAYVSDTMAQMSEPVKLEENQAQAVFGLGCFWCSEVIFQRLDGVSSVESGYMGGVLENPDYKTIAQGNTGYAEVIRIIYDPQKITYKGLLDVFWKAHNPTTLNRQGADVGTQYRSVIFYFDKTQQEEALSSKQQAAQQFDKPIVTEITEASKFYLAENYHQDYYENNRNAPYSRFVINPKLKKLGLQE